MQGVSENEIWLTENSFVAELTMGDHKYKFKRRKIVVLPLFNIVFI